jgi:hypothetical protein
MNADALAGQSLNSINFNNYDDEEWKAEKALAAMDFIGGGGYSLKCRKDFGVPTIYLADTAGEDVLYHELGHIKQDLDLGANSDSCNNWVLEYHNVLSNENAYHKSKEGSEIRTQYDKDGRCLNHVPPGKDWDTFNEEVVAFEESKSEKTRELLGLIKTSLAALPKGKADTVKQNLMSEAYWRNGGMLGRTDAC